MIASLRGQTSDPTWYIDSGASNHITLDMENLALHNEYKDMIRCVDIGNSHAFPLSHLPHNVGILVFGSHHQLDYSVELDTGFPFAEKDM